MDKVFQMPMRSLQCGCHVHVGAGARRYEWYELRSIALGIIRYQHLVYWVLPEKRRKNQYCRLNSEAIEGLTPDDGHPRYLVDTMNKIKAAKTANAIRDVMQNDRYVLWNFDNAREDRKTSGTVEFRGGRGLRGPVRTKRWICFAVGFVEMVLSRVSSSPLFKRNEQSQ